jgi:hypothetical protein
MILIDLLVFSLIIRLISIHLQLVPNTLSTTSIKRPVYGGFC